MSVQNIPRVLRGGSWGYNAASVIVHPTALLAEAHWLAHRYRNRVIGFRCAL